MTCETILILSEIEKYLSCYAISPSRFGRRVAADPRLVFDLRRGRRPKPPMMARICAYLDVPRPG